VAKRDFYAPAATALTDEDRRAIAGLGVRMVSRKRHERVGDRNRGGLVCLAPPPGQVAREAAHAARVAADLAAGLDDAPGVVRCWGPCGRSLPRGSTPVVHGWHVRDVVLTGYPMHEVQCPECHGRWGWIDPPEGV
jgi:hypothetical protein